MLDQTHRLFFFSFDVHCGFSESVGHFTPFSALRLFQLYFVTQYLKKRVGQLTTGLVM